jgi:hypothetical protein
MQSFTGSATIGFRNSIIDFLVLKSFKQSVFNLYKLSPFVVAFEIVVIIVTGPVFLDIAELTFEPEITEAITSGVTELKIESLLQKNDLSL